MLSDLDLSEYHPIYFEVVDVMREPADKAVRCSVPEFPQYRSLAFDSLVCLWSEPKCL